MPDNEVVLELRGIGKSFGETRALQGVDLSLRRGEVRALIGENGAGKSTLMKILSGALPADEGEIIVRGKSRPVHSPQAARGSGIAMIYQELTLAPHLTVEENATLGLEKSAWGLVLSQREKVRQTFALLGHPDISLEARVSSLGVATRQIVEIARALLTDASILIMDEPTSSLTASDTKALFTAISRLKKSGISVIYISHFLEEVKEIADSYTVLRDGEGVGGGRMSETSIPELIRMMVGRPLTDLFPRSPRDIGESLFKVEGAEGSPLPKGVSLELHRGEILGIAGLVGSGRSETLRCLFGLDPAKAGIAVLKGRAKLPLRGLDPAAALSLGLDHLSENRKEEGLAVGMSIRDNMTLSSLRRFVPLGGFGLLDLGREEDQSRKWIGDLNIRCQGPAQDAGNLSGGNQQKVALARLMERGGEILLLDEPTKGVDVGSKAEIYQLIHKLAAEGKGILFVSSYLPELLGVCDTLAVMHRGRLSPVKNIREWDEHSIMRVATSGV